LKWMSRFTREASANGIPLRFNRFGWRSKDALAAKKAQGVKLGGLNAKGVANRDGAKARAEALRPILAELSDLSARAIAGELNARGIATPSGGRWHAETVIRVQRRLAS
jgi:hypothetical protein